ncbi:MAG TPA: hypothetical protein VIV06_10985 [Candidatus Limnocylindrales bacterium]
MASWADFAATAPALAADGHRLLYRTAIGEALLATVRGEASPRLHPIYVAVLEGRLVAFILRSPKATDLAEDGRYALHAHQDPTAPHEFVVRGRARPIDDGPTRDRFAAAWYFEVDDSYRLFEFGIEHAIVGRRGSPDDWPPVYESWRSPAG